MNSLLSPEIMENHVELQDNLELLRAQTVTLAKLKEQVEEKGELGMRKWLQNVTDIEYEADSLEYQFKELSVDRNSLNVRLQLKKEVLECLEQVKDLTEHYYSSSTEEGEILFETPQRYSRDDLVRFTLDFNNKIGSVDFGDVYKGRLTNGVKVAVKVLRDYRGVEDLFSEVRIMGNAYHKNLVKIYGYCSEGNTKAIVYDYMDNGSLDLILYKNPLGIEWGKFYSIAIEMAKALAYLHDGCRKSIIYRDFKPSNVLLDSNLCPRLTDFGVADLMDRDQTHVTVSKIKGTMGYNAPETCMYASRVTSKSDVFSYGMFLFDILGWRENIGKKRLPKIVWDKLNDKKLYEVIVSCDIMEKDRKKAVIVSMVAMWCIQFTPETRPSMSTVATILETEVFVNVPPCPFLTSDPGIFKMLPDMKHSEVSSLTYLGFSSSSRSEVSSFSFDVPQNLDFVEEQESLQGGNESTDSIESLLRELPLEKQNRYSYNELREFSSDFKNKIGSGAYGDVFKGQFSNGMEIAIKELKKEDKEDLIEEFIAELKTICDADHQNLVKLLGFCLESDKKALVYEYMEMGSLDKILYNKPLRIEWEKLYGIAIDVGKALVYLHHDCTPPRIHFDVKPANVLLNSDYSPKLTDFGLSNVKNKEGTYETMSKRKGTPGFGAPEVWMPFSQGSIKCDVYSFGMLLFEILGMAKNNQPTKWFPKHVWENFKNGKLNDVIVERGLKEKDRKKAKILSMVALWCIQFTPETRPTMITVVSVLEKEIAVNKPPDPTQTSDFSVSMQPEQSSLEVFSPVITETMSRKDLKSSTTNIKSMIDLFEKKVPSNT